MIATFAGWVQVIARTQKKYFGDVAIQMLLTCK